MTKNEKIQKLANAIKEFRGAFNTSTGKWIHPPNPAKGERVLFYLDALRLDVAREFKKILQFTTRTEFDTWIKGI